MPFQALEVSLYVKELTTNPLVALESDSETIARKERDAQGE